MARIWTLVWWRCCRGLCAWPTCCCLTCEHRSLRCPWCEPCNLGGHLRRDWSWLFLNCSSDKFAAWSCHTCSSVAGPVSDDWSYSEQTNSVFDWLRSLHFHRYFGRLSRCAARSIHSTLSCSYMQAGSCQNSRSVALDQTYQVCSCTDYCPLHPRTSTSTHSLFQSTGALLRALTNLPPALSASNRMTSDGLFLPALMQDLFADSWNWVGGVPSHGCS